MDITEAKKKLEELKARRAQLETSPMPKVEEPASTFDLEKSKQQLEQLKAKKAELEKKPQQLTHRRKGQPGGYSTREGKEYSPGLHSLQQLGKGALSLPDLVSTIGAPLGRAMLRFEDENNLVEPEDIEKLQTKHPSSLVPETEIPTAKGEKLKGHLARGIGAALPFALTGGPAAALANLGWGGAGGLGSGVLQESGMPALPADILSGLATGAGAVGLSKLGRAFKSSGLTNAEERVARHWQESISPQERTQAIERLRAPQEYPQTGYRPNTAEILHDIAFFPQMQRVRYGIPGSGIAQLEADKTRDLIRELQTRRAGAATSIETQGMVADRLKELKDIRREATKEPYQIIDKMTERTGTPEFDKYAKENIARGQIEDDIKTFQQDLKTRFPEGEVEDVAANRGKYQKAYDEYKQLYDKTPDKVREKMQTPEELYPELSGSNSKPVVGEVSATLKHVRDMGRKAYRSGETNRGQALGKIEEALEKDLEHVPLQRETDKAYHELSKPVNQIEQSPLLMKVIDSRLDDIMPMVYDTHSVKNVQDIKGAIGHNPEQWDKFQKSTIAYIEKRVAPNGHDISGPQLHNFLREKGPALAEVLTDHQIAFLNEMSHISHIKGQAAKMGVQKGTSMSMPTLETSLGLRTAYQDSGAKSLIDVMPSRVGKAINAVSKKFKGFLGMWRRTQHADSFSALDLGLNDPAFAERLLTHEFKNQSDFNKFMNTAIINATRNKKEDEKKRRQKQ
jgi:hypothetical protein